MPSFELYLNFITDKETNDAYKPKYEHAHPLIQKWNKNKKREQPHREINTTLFQPIPAYDQKVKQCG